MVKSETWSSSSMAVRISGQDREVNRFTEDNEKGKNKGAFQIICETFLVFRPPPGPGVTVPCSVAN